MFGKKVLLVLNLANSITQNYLRIGLIFDLISITDEFIVNSLYLHLGEHLDLVFTLKGVEISVLIY